VGTVAVEEALVVLPTLIKVMLTSVQLAVAVAVEQEFHLD
jgi:hypothetical protein